MPLSPKQLRALFPAVLRTSYLNAAASSPIALPVEKAAADHLRETVEWGDVGFSSWLSRKEEIRSRFARFIGAREGEVGFLPSTSMGFQAVGRMLHELGVREVVTLAEEFPSTTLPFLHQGFRLRVVRARADGSYPVEDIAAAVTRRTGAIALSAVQYASGYRAELEALGRLCRAQKLYFAVNGAQALGQVKVDVRAQRIDFLCGTSHKWMMGGYGTGVFFARKALLEKVQLPFAGWLSVEKAMAMAPFVGAKTRGKGRVFIARGAHFRREASALEAGCGAYAPLFSFGAALELIERVGLPTIEAHHARLQKALRRRLRALGFVPNAPDERARGSGICVFRVQGEPHRVAAELAKKGVMVSPRGVGIRVSTHVFNNEEDVDQLFWAMGKLGVRAR
ncbi:MAG: aminotransferase class V-fold PLP-dependent enzyme [Myxococcota bacterium]